MKNIIIIGANGQTAREVIRHLIADKTIFLTLFLRHSQRLSALKGDHIHSVEGDATHFDDLKRAIKGQDIVISTLGGGDLDLKTANIVRAMQEEGVKRLIVLSAGGIYDELPEPFNSWDKSMVGFTRPANLRTAQCVEASNLDYTILRPVWLTNKPTEAVVLTHKGEIFKGTETSRASLGLFIAELVKHPASYIRENLGISQPDTDGGRPAAYR